MLAKLLVDVCGRTAYDNKKNKSDSNQERAEEEIGLFKRFPRIYTFDRQKWKLVRVQLIHLRALMQRRDALIVYCGTNDDAEGINDLRNASLDPNRTNLSAFGKKFQRVIRMIQIYEALAPIRKTLEDHIAADNFDFSAAITQDAINEIA